MRRVFSGVGGTDDQLRRRGRFPPADLAGLSNLKRLVLHDTDVSDEGLAILGRLTSLEHLDLSESRLVGWGIAHLKSLDNLTSLDLNRNWWLSGVALEQLDQLKRLEWLDLAGNGHIRPEAFRHLARHIAQVSQRGGDAV